MTLPARYWRRVVATPDGCWFWTGAISDGGYGRWYTDGGRIVSAHRSRWEDTHGRLLPAVSPAAPLRRDLLCPPRTPHPRQPSRQPSPNGPPGTSRQPMGPRRRRPARPGRPGPSMSASSTAASTARSTRARRRTAAARASLMPLIRPSIAAWVGSDHGLPATATPPEAPADGAGDKALPCPMVTGGGARIRPRRAHRAGRGQRRLRAAWPVGPTSHRRDT